MVAHFKNENRIIITGADRAESLLIKQLVSNQDSLDIKLNEFYDIDGEVNGFSIDATEKEVIEPEEHEDEQVEPNEGE